MKIAILGLPQSGKTTLFRALAAGHYSESGDANLAVVPVPDPRLQIMSDRERSKKIVPSPVTFVDVAGMKTGEDAGARVDKLHVLVTDADALMLVVQAFGDMDYDGNSVEPARALGTLVQELLLTDLAIVENRLSRLEREHKARKKGETDSEWDMLQRVHTHLEQSGWARTLEYNDEDTRNLRGFGLLTMRPALVVFNVAEADVAGDKAAPWLAAASDIGLPAETACATLELEMAQLDDEERTVFLAEYGLEKAARERLIRAAYKLLDIVTFFTISEIDTHAWTIARGTKAKQAAGAIHSDIEKGFVRAEVMAYADYVAAESREAATRAGKQRLEGADYVVQEGDILNVRFTR